MSNIGLFEPFNPKQTNSELWEWQFKTSYQPMEPSDEKLS